MENTSQFERLKQLHEILHAKKGLLNLSNGCSSNSNAKFVNFPGASQQAEKCILTRTSASPELKATDLPSGPSEEKEADTTSNSLFSAVKDFFEDNNAKLIPHKIFVGNISYNLTTPQLKTFFLSFGKVIHAQIVKDRVKRRSKGYGFVTFSNDSEVQRVLQASDEELILDGRILRVNRAEKKKRGRAIRENSDETLDPKTLLENFVRNYNHETSEDLKGMLSEEGEGMLPAFESNGYLNDDVETEENVVNMSSLNDDTLLHIFSFLRIKDRVKVERVCHRWRHLARQTWISLKHLDFKGIFRAFRGTGDLAQCFIGELLRFGISLILPSNTFIPSTEKLASYRLTDGILLSLFKRGCQNLKSLDLSHSSRFLTDYSLHLIGQNCLELQELNLSGVNVTMKSLKDLSSKCDKLKKIELQRCYEVGEKALWWLFKECKELEYFDVGGNIRVTGQCFFMLTDKCKTVILNDCTNVTDNGIKLLIKRCPNLEALNISNCLYLTDTGVSELFMNCGKLKKLSFCKSPKGVSAQSLLALGNVKDLEELELAKHEGVNDDVLYVIGNNCPNLRILNLEACHNATDRGIEYLTHCSQLHILVISYLDKVTDKSIELVAQNGLIEGLYARSCFNITDKAVEQLALHCPHLHELDLSGSERIRNRSLDYLEKYLGNNDGISLMIGGTGITTERVLLTQERFPNWSIIRQDLSDHHLRVDFDPYMDMGSILPDDDEDDDEMEEFGLSTGEYDAEYYLTAEDPSMWEYEQQWMS